MTLLASILDWCNENSGFVMAMLTLVYVLATIGLAFLAVHANSISQKHLSATLEIEKDRMRPYLVFDLFLERHFVHVRLKNVGKTEARNVRIDINPSLQTLLGGKGAYPPEEKCLDISFITKGVYQVAPNAEISALVGHFARFKQEYPTMIFSGTLRYLDPDSTSREYPFMFDLSYAEGRLLLGRKGVEDIAKELESISRTIDHISTGFKKPLIRVVNEVAYQAKEEKDIEQAMQMFDQMKKDGTIKS